MPPRKNQAEYDKNLEDRLRRFDERYEQISRILLGELITGQPGLLQRQLSDEKKQDELMLILHDIKKEMRIIKIDVKSLKDEFEIKIRDLRIEFEWYRKIMTLPTTKKFYGWLGLFIIILVVLSNWTGDAYNIITKAALKYYHNYTDK